MKLGISAIVTLGSIAHAAAFFSNKPAFTRYSPSTTLLASPSEFINTEIASHDVVVFSKSTCPFCAKTKALFEDMNIDATIHELNKMEDGPDVQQALLDLTGQRTVPNVFIKGNHIGGNDDTQAAAKSGKIQELLGL